LTSRIICQINFLKLCLKDNSVDKYLSNRNLKYNNKLKIIKEFSNYKIPSYFYGWLSGFLEVKGCFSVKVKKNNSFSIGQSYDYYILEIIKKYLNLNVTVRNPRKEYYFLETYKENNLNMIIDHCVTYPLLGNKFKTLDIFIKAPFHVRATRI